MSKTQELPVKSITDTLITPANGDPRSPYTNLTTFQYDSNNNVVQESGPSGTINYVYNTATQRHTETWTGTDYANAVSDIVYGYNSMGELASVTVVKENDQTPAAVASSTQYDAVGGTSTTTLPNTVYRYDLRGRLESTFDSATGITTTYTYKLNTNYVQAETSVTSAASVVNPIDHGPTTTDQKTIGISERLFIDHYSLLIERSADARGSTRIVTDATGKVVEDMNYDAFGNALGFNASTALTTYLYSSMPFDAASGNYYDHARYFDTGTGSFTQVDYGYSGSLNNPMTDLPYVFTGGDPINMLDLSGHEFSLPSISVAMNIDETLEADEDGVANEALTSGIKAKEFNFDLGFQLGAGSGGWGPHAFLYVPSRLSGTGLKYDVTGSGDLYVHEEPLAQVLGKTWFGKLFQLAEFSLPQYIEWTSSAWLINAGARGPDLLLDPGVLFTDMHFSYSFLPGTVNCFKWTLLAGVSGWIISKT